MRIERFYLGCLAHASYLVSDAGEAAVIDPQRDVDLYLREAAARNLRIRWVIETHVHADFVSGHVELAHRTGAAICLGAGSGATFEHRALRDGDSLPLGDGALHVLTTPGHTEESICVRIDEPRAVFTGDTLFIGDVGRPDLSPTRTPKELAALLYDSLHEKLLKLDDETLVYPAHGAGSLCGKQMSGDAVSTIGKERRMNYAVQPMSREAFVELLTADLPPRPAYFSEEVRKNRAGAADLEELAVVPPLTPAEVAQFRDAGLILLDTRSLQEFAAAHIPGSIHIALAGQFASWVARVLGTETPIVLVAEDDVAIAESRLRLARVGLENVCGALAGGIAAWAAAGYEVEATDQIAAGEVSAWLETGPDRKILVDVREPGEYSGGAIPGSISIPLADLRLRSGELSQADTVAVHCKGGYRSSIAASLLRSAGLPHVVNVTGGYDAWLLVNATKRGAAI
jgi:glyoxylase-like metal-dependent hydrolase (beta-lactamase superfamily II)/rhodanese-related sulfurtransferase